MVSLGLRSENKRICTADHRLTLRVCPTLFPRFHAQETPIRQYAATGFTPDGREKRHGVPRTEPMSGHGRNHRAGLSMIF